MNSEFRHGESLLTSLDLGRTTAKSPNSLKGYSLVNAKKEVPNLENMSKQFDFDNLIKNAQAAGRTRVG